MIYDLPLIGWAYRHGPAFTQSLMLSGYGAVKRLERLGPSFRRYTRDLQTSQWWSTSALAELQAERLRELIRHAYETVPYYRRVFDERHLTPSDIRRPDDLYKLPILTKQLVRAHRAELRSRSERSIWVRTGRTGGTTGIPLWFSLDRERIVFDHALVHRHWSWAGYKPGHRVAVLRGFTVIPPHDRSGVFWREDWVEHRLYLSGFHLSSATMAQYVDVLRSWQPRFIAAYPSNLFRLARYMQQAGESLRVEAVFTGSEILTPVERALIERQFQCRVWDRYGTGERLVVGQQCEHGSYHQNVEFGILQVDQPRGVPASPGTTGELIQTTLTNRSMPLIRYASDDQGFVIAGVCPCGRGLPLMGPVEGRKDAVIVTRDGRAMPQAGLDQIHEFVEAMERCQLVQHRVGEIIVRVVPRPGFGDADRRELVEQIQRRVGLDTNVRVEITDDLPLTVTGKERFIVSTLSAEALDGPAHPSASLD